MIVVITNKAAGSGADDKMSAIQEAFSGVREEVEVFETAGSDLTDAARAAKDRGARVVVAAGGDGTVNAVASALVNGSVPLGVLPMGTLNHFAKDAEIPLDLAEAAALIATGTARPIDVACVNDRIFLNNSSIGIYPLMVRDRDHQRSRLRRSKWWAMMAASLALFRRFPTFDVTITKRGSASTCRTPAVLVGNNSYAFSIRGLGTRESLDAGVLGVYVVRTRSRWSAVGLFVNALFRQLDADGLCDVSEASELTLEQASGVLDVSLDGEVVPLASPLAYRTMPQALLVIAPITA